MQHITLLILGVFLSLYAFAKNDIDDLQETNFNYFVEATFPEHLDTFPAINKDFKRNPYFTADKVLGKIFTSDTTMIDTLFRYNLYHDCIELSSKTERRNLILLKDGFSFYDPEAEKTRVFVSGFEYYENYSSPFTNYEILYSGKVKLLVRHEKKIVKDKNKTDASAANSKTIEKKYFYVKYIYIQDGDDFIPIEFNRKSILKGIGNDEIRKFLKKNRNRCKTEEDVIEVLRFYENLKK